MLRRQAIVDLFEDRERYDKPFTAKLTSFIDASWFTSPTRKQTLTVQVERSETVVDGRRPMLRNEHESLVG